LSKDAIFEKIKELLISEFKVDPALIALNKRFDEDLELDSLDLVDLTIALNDHIGDRVDPTLFKNIRTVQDAVELIASRTIDG